MNHRETPKGFHRVAASRPFRAIAHALVTSIVLTSLPSPTHAKWQTQPLPGTVSKGEVIGVGAAGAAGIGLLIFALKHGKGRPPLAFDIPPVRFDDLTPGQPAKREVLVKNLMHDTLRVKEISVKGGSGAVAVSGRQVPFTLAPLEPFNVLITVSGQKDHGKAQLRFVASAPRYKKDAVKKVTVSYGPQKSKAGKLVPLKAKLDSTLGYVRAN